MGIKGRILIVDDDSSVRKVLTAILEEKGYDVEAVGNRREAMEGTALLTEMKETVPKNG